MVIRQSKKAPPTPAQIRRSAQRKLARDLKAGNPILPKEITSKAKSVVSERKSLVKQIYDIKQNAFGDRPKWNAKNALKAINIHDKTGKLRSVSDLRHILNTLRNAATPDSVFSDEDIDDDVISALHYH